MNAVADKLDEARALIERGWVQDNCVTDAGGQPCSYDDAVNCCAFGAVALLTQSCRDYWLRVQMLDLLSESIGGQEVIPWNDREGRTKDEVVAAFKRAAELAREQVLA